jgi:steroid delta-isomerase-like uncharacterized protein
MSNTEQTLAVVRKVLDAFTAHDVNAFRDLLAPDAILHIGGGPTIVTGVDAILATVSITLQAIPDLRVTAISLIAQGTLAAAELIREGTHTGMAIFPDGTPLPPSGRSVRLPESLWFTVRDGKVVRMAPYVDMLDTLQQLGAIPSPTGPST